jgi:hypothetical protein
LFNSSFFYYLGIIITTSGFIFTWTPYAVTFFVSAFQGKDYALPPLATFFCACFAKSSVIWIPLLYIGTSTQFQFTLVNPDALDQTIANNRVDATVNNASTLPRRKDEAGMGTVEDRQPTATNNY